MIALRLPKLMIVCLSVTLAGCSTFGSSSGSSASGSDSGFFTKLGFPGTPETPKIVEYDKNIDCPPAFIREGGAVIRNSKGQTVSSQMTIRNVARECAEDGQGLTVKVGVEGIAVIGAAGKPGPVSGGLTITVDRDGKTIATRATRATATIGADGQALFSLVEEGIKIPPGDGETLINVGFKQ